MVQHLRLNSPDGKFDVQMNLIGEFSVANALAATAALYAKGMATSEIVNYLGKIDAVKGRMEKVETELPLTMYIDYAHTPDAIKKAIEAVLPYKTNKLIFRHWYRGQSGSCKTSDYGGKRHRLQIMWSSRQMILAMNHMKRF